jgi:UDP-glucose 4-epimerase
MEFEEKQKQLLININNNNNNNNKNKNEEKWSIIILRYFNPAGAHFSGFFFFWDRFF